MMFREPFAWEREPTPEGDQIPAGGVWVSEFDDHTQTYMISGPEGESESGEYTAVEQTGRAGQILAIETQAQTEAEVANVRQAASDAQLAADAAATAAVTAQQEADAAAQAAADAAGIADGKADLWTTSTAPPAEYERENVLWVDPATKAVKRWDGTSWAAVDDQRVIDAAAAAAAADFRAENAEQEAAIARQEAAAAHAAAGAASDLAQSALESADGKTSLHWDKLAPTGTGKQVGDVWWQWTPQAVQGDATVARAWTWDGQTWVETTFGDAVLDTLSAGKITTGRLAVGTKITVGDPSDAHAILGHDGLHLMANPDGSGLREVAQMGTGSAAVWSVTGPRQETQDGDVYPILAQATAEGDVIGRVLSASDDVLIGGESIRDMLSAAMPKPMGIFVTTADQMTSGKVWKNAGILTIPMRPNRLYQISVDGRIGPDWAHDTRGEIALSYSYAADQSATPPVPYVNATTSTRLATWGISFDEFMEVKGKQGFSFTHWFVGWGTKDNVRFGFAFNNWGSANQIRLAKGSRLTIIDHGPVDATVTKGYELNAATPADMLPTGGGEQEQETAPNVPQTYTITFTADALKSWRGDSSTTPLQHGTYGGVQRYSHMSMPDMSKVTGAVEVLKVEVWLKCTHVRWSAGVDVAIGTSLNDTVTSPQTSGSYPERSRWRAGEAKWVELKGQVHKARAKAGQLRGIVLGEGANIESMYAHFSMSASDVKLRITYRK